MSDIEADVVVKKENVDNDDLSDSIMNQDNRATKNDKRKNIKLASRGSSIDNDINNKVEIGDLLINTRRVKIKTEENEEEEIDEVNLKVEEVDIEDGNE